MLQLDLMSFFTNTIASKPQLQPQAKPQVITTNPKPVNPKPAYTIDHGPKGFKVVPAPGLTTKMSANPCLSCPQFGEDMNECSEHCIRVAERSEYLRQIGVELVSGVSGDGYYAIGN